MHESPPSSQQLVVRALIAHTMAACLDSLCARVSRLGMQERRTGHITEVFGFLTMLCVPICLRFECGHPPPCINAVSRQTKYCPHVSGGSCGCSGVNCHGGMRQTAAALLWASHAHSVSTYMYCCMLHVLFVHPGFCASQRAKCHRVLGPVFAGYGPGKSGCHVRWTALDCVGPA